MLKRQYRKYLFFFVLALSINLSTKAQTKKLSGDYHLFGDTIFEGVWSIKGAKNQSGSILSANYNIRDTAYTLATTSGYLFFKKENETDWKVINNTNKFDDLNSFCEVVKDSKKYLTTISNNGFLAHSNDSGKTWQSGKGLEQIQGFCSVQKMVKTNNGYIYILLKQNTGKEEITLYKSINYGFSFSKIKTFTSPILLALNNYDIAKIHNNDSSLILAFTDTLAFYNPKLDSFEFHSKIPTYNFRETRIAATIIDNIPYLYILRGGRMFFYNKQAIWEQKSQVSFEANSPYSFEISSQKHNHLFIGDDLLYKSSDTGKTWSVQNDLNDFFMDKSKNLHPGINFIQTFETHNKKAFQLVATDGGLFNSSSNFDTLNNLTNNNIINAEYYDFSVSKNNLDQLFTASKNQGFQQFLSFYNDSTIATKPILWGDCFDLAKSGNDDALWIVTTSSVGFLSDLNGGFFKSQWNFSDSLIRGIERPKIVTHPSDRNKAFCVGFYSKNDATKASHIYELTVVGNTIEVTRLEKNFNLNFSKTEFIVDLEISALDTNSYYLITNNGNFYYSINSGIDWKRSAFFSGLEANEHFGSDIYASETTLGAIYVGGKGNGNGSIFISKNNGKDFSLFAQGLRSTDVVSISAVNKDSLVFVATIDGPFVYSVKKQNWTSLLTNEIPNKDWTQVHALNSEKTVWFSTFGRGLYRLNYRDFEKKAKSIHEQLSNDYKLLLSPNPTQDILFINTKSNKLKELSIYTVLGIKQTIFSKEINRQGTKIDVSNLKAGVYIISTLSDKNLRQTGVFIKQ